MGSKIRLGIIYGGKSSEHEVSLRTALSIMKAVDPNRYEITPLYVEVDGGWVKGEQAVGHLQTVETLRLVATIPTPTKQASPVLAFGQELDVIFPVIHGPNGEDGTLQGLLELANIPYVGTGVMASSVGMDKWMMKTVFAQAGLRQVKYVGVLRSRVEHDLAGVVGEIESEIGYPCFVKPANMGSSVGISKAKDRESLEEALRIACKFDRRLVVEAFVKAREVEIGILGNDDLQTSVVGEVIAAKEFYDYEAKYKGAGTELQIPALIPKKVEEEIAVMAKKAFQAIDGSGLSRVDFFWDEEHDLLYINEINTMPGFTPFSMYPMLFDTAGIPYAELIDRLVQLAIERHEEKQKNIVAAEELE